MEITRLYRLLEMITLLKSGRRYDAEALATELEVSRRTIFRDLNIMSAAGIPYYFDEETDSYAIKRSFFLPAVNFTIDESLAIMLATRKMLGQLSLPLFQQASKAAIKIESSLPPIMQDHCGSVIDNIDVRWSAIADEGGLDQNFSQLRMAVERQRKVLVRYDSLHDGGDNHPIGKSINVVLSPYRLVFIHRAWYVLGHSDLHGEVRTFKLSRFASIEILEEMFVARPDFSMKEYLGDAWIMIPEGKMYDVELIFSPKVSRNVAEVNWHHNQECEFLDDGSLRFKVKVDGIMEISWWVLGYGGNVRVVSPKKLRKIIKSSAQQMVDMYNDDDDDIDSEMDTE